MLVRAFGPPAAPWSLPVDGERASEIARTLHLAGRIGQRHGLRVLAREVGPKGARSLVLVALVARTCAWQLQTTLFQLLRLAEAHGIPLCLLKGAALLHSGPGLQARLASDLDLFLPGQEATQFFALLRRSGCRVVPESVGHHLPPLLWGAIRVELHTTLPGFRGEKPLVGLTFEKVRSLGLLVPAPGASGGVFLPDRPLMLLHLMVHGLYQHRFTPWAYPLTRTLADLVDLALEGRDLLPVATLNRLVGAPLPEREIRHLISVVEALRDGVVGENSPERSIPSRILHHAIAGLLEPRYARTLRLVSKVHFVLTRWRQPLQLSVRILQKIHGSRW